jgi:PEGA domain
VHARQIIIVALACLGLVLPQPVHAQTEPAPSALEQAKEQFRRGVALLNAGDTEGALEDFLRSRELVPSGKNSVNAAICLERLERYDEAFELYEEVVARFATDLEPVDRENLAPVMASLRAKIGYLEVSANVDGDVIVRGRPRGRLPFRTALRVLPGPQTIRILKDGYRPYESTVVLVAGEIQRLDARLEPLSDEAPAPLATPISVAPDHQPNPSPSSRSRPKRWQLNLGAIIGGIYAARTRAGLESSCTENCAQDGGVLGGRAALVLGVQHESGFGVELDGGYALFRQKLSRAVFDGDVTYALDQTLTAKGVTAVLRGHFERRIGLGLDFSSAAGGGLWFANFQTRVSGVAWTTDAAGVASSAQAVSAPTAGSASETLPFVALALGLEHRWGRTSLGLELGAWLLPGVGPSFHDPVLGSGAPCGATTQNAVACSSKVLAGERAHGDFWLLTPEIMARYAL